MKLSKKLFILLVFFLYAGVALAQPGGGGDPGHGQPVPITGLEILLAAGSWLGIRKYWNRFRRNNG